MPNYSLTINSAFSPFTMQEMVYPFAQYKQEWDKLEEQSVALQDKANKFKYLSETLPEDSKARQIYEGYANQLDSYADDILKRGLNMSNRRGLSSMKRRYSGEIGRLEEADTAMQKEKELRRQMNAKDSSMLYATDNLNIDNFLDRNTPNLYNISGNELYTRGAAAGKAASSRVYGAGEGGKTLGGYYRDWVEKMGYNAESMKAFRENAAAIPELQMQAEAILQERGVNDNLTGASRERARQAVINGMIDGAVYQEKHNPVRDIGVLDAYQNSQLQHQVQAEARQEKEDSKQDWMFTWDKDTGKATGYSPAYIEFLKQEQQIKKSKRGAVVGATGAPGDTDNTDDKTQLSAADKAFIALNKNKTGYEQLKGSKGFDIQYGGRNNRYKYVGGIKHNLHTGKMGEGSDRWFGFTSASNITDRLGNYSTKYMPAGTRVLTETETIEAVVNKPELMTKISDLLTSQGYDIQTADFRLIRVPREYDNGGDEYLVAVNETTEKLNKAKAQLAKKP